MQRKTAVLISIIGVLVSLAGVVFIFIDSKKIDWGMGAILFANVAILFANLSLLKQEKTTK